MFVEVEAMRDVVGDPGKLRDGGVFFAKSKLLVW
jgi:hypothetical protein